MKKVFIGFLAVVASCLAHAQNLSMELKYGSDREDMNQLLSFQNIYMETISFNGAELKGKYFQVFIKEFKEGIKVKTDTLFDGSEVESLKINTNSFSFRFFAQTENNELKLQLLSPRFNSRKLNYTTSLNARDYALKDFFGAKKKVDVTPNKSIYTFAIITPIIRKDGSGSYCEVAQSGKDPE